MSYCALSFQPMQGVLRRYINLHYGRFFITRASLLRLENISCVHCSRSVNKVLLPERILVEKILNILNFFFFSNKNLLWR